ncbi:DNA translocase FtsK [Paenibacillus peoriae]|uniref:FtsK/SpoIIIE domain-containing protein n=1 Tax=Paenibacillus peoriae TaxID=59893 RepID=UPI000CECCABE|nr:FtsK/SpoIIIE domain-containing protein [Paenibacillus peoriae]PPQ48329.1 DNA translocase FtsK [Paenibacillus peoriae]
MDEIELIGRTATEFFKNHLQEDSSENSDGVARFLLDRLTGEIVSRICQCILQDVYLNAKVEIKVPKQLVVGYGLPDDVITEYKTTHWRNAPCDKEALILANTNDDQGPSLREIITIGAGDLKGVPKIWVDVASEGLLLTDELKGYWEKALKGLQEANECSLEQYSRYVICTRNIIVNEGLPLINALGWALPSLRIPRDSSYFDAISSKKLNHSSQWKKMFQNAFSKRACYLIKQNPNRQLLEKEALEATLNRKKDDIPLQHHSVIEAYIYAQAGWNDFSEKLAELEWERDKVHLMFEDVKLVKAHLATRTLQHFEDEFPELLTDADISYLQTLENRKIKEANEDDKDFYEQHRQELELERSIKADWDKFVYGKPIECDDFFVGMLEAVERLFAQCENANGTKSLKIKVTKGNGKKTWLDLNEDIAMYFCVAYRGLEKLTNRYVQWETGWLFKYDELVEEKKEPKKNTSTSRSALQISFDIELHYNDVAGNKQKDAVRVVWKGNPNTIGMELYDDLKRLSLNAFSYSNVGKNPISKKGKIQNISLNDVGTLQAVFGQDRGSLISTLRKSEDISKIFKKNLELALFEARVTPTGFEAIKSKWETFSQLYLKAITDYKNVGISEDSLIDQCQAYDDLLRSLHLHAQGDVNRIELWHHLMKIGNVQVEGKNTISIIAPWHPMRLAAKAVKARQVSGLINHVLISNQIDFGDPKLFFSDLRTELQHPYYPEVTVGFEGQQAHLLTVSDTVNDYSLMESPVKETEGLDTNEDPREASVKVLSLVKKYLDLQPHERTNLSVVLFNCDSTRLPEAIVGALTSLHDREDEVRCQVILRHRDADKLNNLYMKMIEGDDIGPDTFIASEVSRDFMARLRIEVMADAAPLSDTSDGKPADIVFLQDVISRQAKLNWGEEQIINIPMILEHYPPRWARRRSAAKDDLKSIVYLTCPSQPSVGITYLGTLYSITNSKEPKQDVLYLPARQITFQNEYVRGIFDEAHSLGEWVVNYDDLLERRQLRSLGVKVIKYQHNQNQGPNLIVSSKSKLNMLQVLVKRRLESLNLGLDDSALFQLTEKFIDDANGISGDIVLRAAKRGVFAGELIGVVLSKMLLQSEFDASAIGWFFLDDYASWLGQKEEQIADILAMCPKVMDGNPYLQVIVSEAKYVESKGAAEHKKNSQKQLRDTIVRMDNAIFGSPGRLDRDLWLSRLGDMLNDGLEFSQNEELSIEQWREGIRDGSIPIELKGYSHVFLSTSSDIAVEGEQWPISNTNGCYQEVYPRELVRELVLAYHQGETGIKVRERVGDERPWNTYHAKLPAKRVRWWASEEESIEVGTPIVTISSLKNEKSILVQEEISTQIDSITREQILILNTDEGEKVPWTSSRLSNWINSNLSPEIENEEIGKWVDHTVTVLKAALISYNLQAKVLDHRLTPNAIVIKLKGSDQLRVEDIEKKKSQLLTTHALDIINIIAQPGEIVVSVARPYRETITLGDVWKIRKLQSDSSEINMSFIIGIKEVDGEILYLNLGGTFENLEQHAPHTLIAGATGSGKSVLLQNLILDICMTNTPNLAKIYLIDPKFGVDYQHLEDLPHLAEGIIIDQQRAVSVLEFLVEEMDRRYLVFREQKVNNLKAYNAKVSTKEKIPLLFLIHDEFAEWMLIDTYKSAVSSIVQRLGVKARAAGIHLIFAAQRPDANVLPVQLRDNLGNRLILRVESIGTSEIALGEKGAEKLLGKGHLVARLQGESSLIYGQVPFITNEGIDEIAELLKK